MTIVIMQFLVIADLLCLLKLSDPVCYLLQRIEEVVRFLWVFVTCLILRSYLLNQLEGCVVMYIVYKRPDVHADRTLPTADCETV